MKFVYLLVVVLLFSCLNKDSKNESVLAFDEKVKEIESEFDISKLDSLRELLIGTKMNAYQFTDLEGKVIDLGKIEKPIVLEATASWCKPCKALTPALNAVSKKFHEDVEFILLTHDMKEKAVVLAEQLDPSIRIVPSKFKQNPNGLSKLGLDEFQQVFPFPTTYFIDKDKTIRTIKIGGPVPKENTTEEIDKVNEYNIATFEKAIEKII